MRLWITMLMVWLAGVQASAQFEKLEVGARRALAKDEPYRALTLTERALTRKGAPEVFHIIRAEAYNRIGMYRKAMDELRKADARKATAEYRTNLMAGYTGLGRLDSAEALIVPIIATDASEEYLYRAGRVLALRGEWSRALEHFNAGVERGPGSARMFRERGACHAMLGDSAKARQDFDNAISLAPRDAAAYNSRGYYRFMAFGEYGKAIADMDRAIKQDPNYGFAFSNRGWCHFQLGDTAKARRDLNLAVRKNPTNAYAYRSLGIIDKAAGDVVKACANLHKALELGFTGTYGNEVQELVQRDCSSPVIAPAPPPVQAPPVPPPSNAPDQPVKPRTNAP